MKKIFRLLILSILYIAIYFSSNNLHAIEGITTDKLMRVTISCEKSKSGKRPWSDAFYAVVTENTFQGSRYWKGTPPRYKSDDIGYEIFTGFKTKDTFTIRVKGRYIKHGDKWEYKLRSKGELSIKEHLRNGITGTRGNQEYFIYCTKKEI